MVKVIIKIKLHKTNYVFVVFMIMVKVIIVGQMVSVILRRGG